MDHWTLNNICRRVCFHIFRVWSAQFILQRHEAHTESGTNLGGDIPLFHLGVRGWRGRGPAGSQKIEQSSAVVSFLKGLRVRLMIPAGKQDVCLDTAMPAGQGGWLMVAREHSRLCLLEDMDCCGIINVFLLWCYAEELPKRKIRELLAPVQMRLFNFCCSLSKAAFSSIASCCMSCLPRVWTEIFPAAVPALLPRVLALPWAQEPQVCHMQVVKATSQCADLSAMV